jgi:hypothetical protein
MLLAALMSASVATQAPAQAADVFSGEHPNSSRIVVRLDRPAEVSAVRVDDGYRVRFVPRAPALDLSGVFRLIPRDRISDVRQDPDDGSLLILSECDCVLDTFVAGPFTYGIDLRDRRPDEPRDPPGASVSRGSPDRGAAGPSDEPGSPEPGVPARADGARPAIAPAGGTLPAGTTIAAAGNMPGIALPASSLLPFPLLRAPPTGERSGADRGRENPMTRVADASEASPPASAAPEPMQAMEAGDLDSLAESLRRAADAGVVELRDQGGGTGRLWSARDGSAQDGSDDRFREVESASRRLSALADNLSISLGSGTRPDDGAEKPSSGTCPPADRFGFLSGNADGDAYGGLRALRAGLVTEAGDIDPDGALALAERYLALGFGAEAAQLLAVSELSPEQAAAYASLARIVDTTGDRAPDVWRGKEACPSDVALWALLGQGGRIPPNNIDATAVQRAFFGLNAPMRLHLGPVLARQLDALDQTDAATAIRTNIEPLQIASAERDVDGGANSTETGPVAGPGAAQRAVTELLARAQSAMRAGRPIRPDDLSLAEALSWEYRGTEEGIKLAGMTALGRLVDNDVPGAMAILQEQWRQADPAWTSTLTDAFTETVVAKGDAELLELVLHPRGDEVTALLDGAQRVAVADRLTGVGFPELALDLLAELEEPATGLRRARAAAHLSAGDPARALALVAGLPGRQAAAVRAGALEALERFALAARAYADAGDADGAARAAWLSGDERTIAAFGSDRHRDLATRLARPPATDDPPGLPAQAAPRTGPGPAPVDAGRQAAPARASTPGARPEAPPGLGEGQALIERSAALRNDISELLESFAE